MSIFDKFSKSEEDKKTPKDLGQVDNDQKVKAKVEKKASPKKEGSTARPVKKNKDQSTNQVLGVLIKPLITEKSSNLGQLNKYVFAVSKKSNKIKITKAIESRYGVRPLQVNIINNKGKVVRYGRTWGRRKSWKKAVITLPQGKSIEIHEGV